MDFLFDRAFQPIPAGILAGRDLYLGSHDPWLVALSIGIATLAGLVALTIAGHLSQVKGRWPRLLWLGAGSIVLAGGIWAMHFIGMLAFSLPCGIGYDLPLTLASTVPALLASFAALAISARATRPGRWQVLAGGIAIGLGIGAMHYTGMAAMRLEASLVYDPALVALSILVAAGLAWGSLALNTRLVARAVGGRILAPARLPAALFMGLAIAGMHYTAMSAAMFLPLPAPGVDAPALPRDLLALLIALVIAAVVTATLAVVFASVQRETACRLREAVGQREAAQVVLRRKESQLRIALDNMADGLCLLDGGQRVVVANARFMELTGLTPAALAAGQGIAAGLPALAEFLVEDGAAGQGGKRSIALRLGSRDVELRRTFVEKGGQVLLVHDISAQKQVEAELREARTRAEQAMQAKGVFLANMSHEIRTPTNAVLGVLELALDSPDLPVDLRRNLEIADRSAGALLRIIDDILDLSRLESGAMRVERLALSLPDCLRTVQDMLGRRATKKGLALSVTMDRDVPEWVAGDPTRLSQVLLNLVGNAVKFTDAGSVSVRVSKEGQEGGLLRFEVRDTGVGIAPDRLEAIFEPFSQEDESTTRRFGGSGLGTTISRDLVQLMGGRIWAESRPGEGATFTFVLPLPQAEPPMASRAAQEGPATVPAAVAAGRRPGSILVVEDVPEIRTLLDLHLRRQGHEVLQARDGTEGVERFRKEAPDLVLMDVQMPVMDGLAATAAIRAIENEKRSPQPVPIIGLSAAATPGDRQTCLASGMTDLAGKPVNFRNLVALIERHLTEGRADVGAPKPSRPPPVPEPVAAAL